MLQHSGLELGSLHYDVRNTFIHLLEEGHSNALVRSTSSPARICRGSSQFCMAQPANGGNANTDTQDGVLDRLLSEFEHLPPKQRKGTLAWQDRCEHIAGPTFNKDVASPRLEKQRYCSAASTTASEADLPESPPERWTTRRQRVNLRGHIARDKAAQKVVDESCAVTSPVAHSLNHPFFTAEPAMHMNMFQDVCGASMCENATAAGEMESWSYSYPTWQSMGCLFPESNSDFSLCPSAGMSTIVPVSLTARLSTPPQAVSCMRPSFGKLHHFHVETRGTGELSGDCRTFTKKEYQGRLSVITEAEVHSSGVTRHVVQFTSGELSAADGVGFVFSRTLPCPKNIKRITSIFVNRSGRICLRGGSDVVRSNTSVSKLKVGDWIEMIVDLHKTVATFTVWPANGASPTSAVFAFGSALVDLNIQVARAGQPLCGYLACVVQNLGVTTALCS